MTIETHEITEVAPDPAPVLSIVEPAASVIIERLAVPAAKRGQPPVHRSLACCIPGDVVEPLVLRPGLNLVDAMLWSDYIKHPPITAALEAKTIREVQVREEPDGGLSSSMFEAVAITQDEAALAVCEAVEKARVGGPIASVLERIAAARQRIPKRGGA